MKTWCYYCKTEREVAGEHGEESCPQCGNYTCRWCGRRLAVRIWTKICAYCGNEN